LGLDPGQRRDHLEPAPEPAFLAEHRAGLVRPPQVPVEDRVRDPVGHRTARAATARRSPSLICVRLAPQGTTTGSPSLATRSSSRQHLVSSVPWPPALAWPLRLAARLRGHMSTCGT